MSSGKASGRSGKWKEPSNTKWRLIEYEYMTCSVCGEWAYSDFNSMSEARSNWDEKHLYPYCPFCGAKMFTDDKDKDKEESK